jgi:hypothetical protein
MDAVRHFELALDKDTELVRPTKKSRKERERTDIKSLVKEFFGAPSAECSININSNSGDMSVLERWFAELDIAWVLHLPDADGDDASAELHHTSADAAKSWIRGLHRILEAIRSTPTVFSGLPKVCDSEDQPVPESDKQDNNVPDQIHFARFTKEAMSKMLPFVDFAIRQVVVCTPYKKLHTMLGVYEALSDVTKKIWGLFYPIPEGAYNIKQETVSLVSAKKEEAGEAIWSTMEPIRTRALESIDIEYVDGSSSSLIPQASSDIHKVTLSVMEFISFLGSNYPLMCQIVSKAVCLNQTHPGFIASAEDRKGSAEAR